MDFTSFAIILGIAFSGLTTAVTFGRNPTDPLNRTFMMWGTASFLWGAGILMRLHSCSAAPANVFFSVGMFGAMATVGIYFFFTTLFLRRVITPPISGRFFLVANLLVLASGLLFFSMVPASSWVIESFVFEGKHSTVRTGPGFTAIIIWALITVASAFVMILVFYGRIGGNQERKQAHAVAAAPVLPAIFFGVVEFTMSPTVTGVLLGETYMATVLFTMVIAYGILRHRLMVITPEMAAGQVLAALPEGVALVDLAGIIQNSNKAFQELLGRTEEGIEGAPIWDFVEGDENPDTGKAKSGSTTRLEFQFGIRRPEGEMVPVAATYEPLFDRAGEPIGSIAVFRDLRALRRLQAELTQAEKLAGIGELVAGVAHEFNSPLTVMLGLSEMGANAVKEEESRGKFQRIFEQAVRAREIVSKLLQFARKGDGKRVVCDLHAQIDEAIELAKLSGRTEGITIRTDLAPADVRIECNPEEIRQVFMNLIQNAIHAILGDRKTGSITVKTELKDGWFATRVEDDGPGISEDILMKVFDPFFTTKEVGKGTGLGLSICHGILKDHGGKISVERNTEGGVTFLVELPAGREDAPNPRR